MMREENSLNIFSVSSDIQDVEILLGNVADALKQWESGGATTLDLSMMLGEAGKLSQRAGRLKSQWNVNSNAIIQSTRPGLGPWIIRFQHLVRRLTWWFTEPIVMQVRAFQMNAAMATDGLAQQQEELLQMIQQQTAQITALEQRIKTLEQMQQL